jgi:hypothetical protein
LGEVYERTDQEVSTHDSRPEWVAIPSPYGSFIRCLMSVYPDAFGVSHTPEGRSQSGPTRPCQLTQDWGLKLEGKEKGKNRLLRVLVVKGSVL